jgi:hypothetical protein
VIRRKLQRRLELLEARVLEEFREPIGMTIDLVEPGGEISGSITLELLGGARSKKVSQTSTMIRCGIGPQEPETRQ